MKESAHQHGHARSIANGYRPSKCAVCCFRRLSARSSWERSGYGPRWLEGRFDIGTGRLHEFVDDFETRVGVEKMEGWRWDFALETSEMKHTEGEESEHNTDISSGQVADIP